MRQIALRKKRPEERRREHVWRWVLIFLIATCTAVIALSIGAASEALQNVKFAVVSAFLEKGAVLSGFGAFFGMNLALVLCASTLVAYVEPVAAGSGIPEIKCILNGLKIPRAVRVKTLFCKALGVTAGVAAGLPIGKEGPMIHAGAVCGAGLSYVPSTAAVASTAAVPAVPVPTAATCVSCSCSCAGKASPPPPGSTRAGRSSDRSATTERNATSSPAVNTTYLISIIFLSLPIFCHGSPLLLYQ